jgi:hypothetical protein
VISKKRLDAEKILTKNLEEKKVLEIENAHKKENVTNHLIKIKMKELIETLKGPDEVF